MITAGIDVGSASIKIAFVEGERALLSRTERIRRRDPKKIAESLFASALAANRTPATVSAETARVLRLSI